MSSIEIQEREIMTGMRNIIRTIHRAKRLGDKLRLKLYVCKKELEANMVWRIEREKKLEYRLKDLSSRICLVECIEYLSILKLEELRAVR